MGSGTGGKCNDGAAEVDLVRDLRRGVGGVGGGDDNAQGKKREVEKGDVYRGRRKYESGLALGEGGEERF